MPASEPSPSPLLNSCPRGADRRYPDDQTYSICSWHLPHDRLPSRRSFRGSRVKEPLLLLSAKDGRSRERWQPYSAQPQAHLDRAPKSSESLSDQRHPRDYSNESTSLSSPRCGAGPSPTRLLPPIPKLARPSPIPGLSSSIFCAIPEPDPDMQFRRTTQTSLCRYPRCQLVRTADSRRCWLPESGKPTASSCAGCCRSAKTDEGWRRRRPEDSPGIRSVSGLEWPKRPMPERTVG